MSSSPSRCHADAEAFEVRAFHVHVRHNHVTADSQEFTDSNSAFRNYAESQLSRARRATGFGTGPSIIILSSVPLPLLLILTWGPPDDRNIITSTWPGIEERNGPALHGAH